jgi:hypothetical protein
VRNKCLNPLIAKDGFRHMKLIPDNPPLPLGTKIGKWKIAAVGVTGGERYYWLTKGKNEVAMWPHFMVEPQAQPVGGAKGKNRRKMNKPLCVE